MENASDTNGSCHHIWQEYVDHHGEPSEELECINCETTVSDALTKDGYVEMPCGHVFHEGDFNNERELLEHVNYGWVGEGTIKTCEMSMPDWTK